MNVQNKTPAIDLLRDTQDELHRIRQMLDATQNALEGMCLTAQELNSILWALVDSFDADDQQAITVQLRRMSDNRKAAQARKPKVH